MTIHSRLPRFRLSSIGAVALVAFLPVAAGAGSGGAMVCETPITGRVDCTQYNWDPEPGYHTISQYDVVGTTYLFKFVAHGFAEADVWMQDGGADWTYLGEWSLFKSNGNSCLAPKPDQRTRVALDSLGQDYWEFCVVR